MKPELLFEYYRGAAREAFEAFCTSCAHPYAYASWIAQTYAYVSQTVPTMRSVACGCGDQRLRALLEEKANEELNHDQDILDNLRCLGFGVGEFEISRPIQRLIEITKSIPSSSDHPLSQLVGHMLVLEVMHPSLNDVERIASHFGVPVQATSAFLAHSELDIDHAVSVMALLDHGAVSQPHALGSAVRVLQIFRDHWVWMTDFHMNQSA